MLRNAYSDIFHIIAPALYCSDSPFSIAFIGSPLFLYMRTGSRTAVYQACSLKTGGGDSVPGAPEEDEAGRRRRHQERRRRRHLHLIKIVRSAHLPVSAKITTVL